MEAGSYNEELKRLASEKQREIKSIAI